MKDLLYVDCGVFFYLSLVACRMPHVIYTYDIDGYGIDGFDWLVGIVRCDVERKKERETFARASLMKKTSDIVCLGTFVKVTEVLFFIYILYVVG